MDKKIVELWNSKDWNEDDIQYEEETIDSLSAKALMDCVLSFADKYGAEEGTGWEYINESVIESVRDKNDFDEPITQEQYEFLIDNSMHYGATKGYDLSIGTNTGHAVTEKVSTCGRQIKFGCCDIAELIGLNSWKAIVWDNDYFDEVLSIPEDLQAVDLHDAYQFGEHLEHGNDFLICRYEGEYVRFEF